MRLGRIVVGTAILLMSALTPAASAGTGQDCAYRLVPLDTSGKVVESELVLVGCYATYAEALSAGSEGSIQVDASLTPDSITDSLAAGTLAASDVLLGTEYDYGGYAGSTASYFAPTTCTASTTYEISYVTNAWNDSFEAGKGFGGCDRNRKFEDSNFNGASILCTPNCSFYGTLANRVSSLRWRS